MPLNPPTVAWGTSSAEEFRTLLSQFGMCILRGYGSDPSALDGLMALGGFSRFVDDLGRSIVSLSVDPREISHAERALAGDFHTDYSQHPRPPDYVAIACTTPDPRYPYYGRNQVVEVQQILRKIVALDAALYARVVRASFPVMIRGREYDSPLVSRLADGTPVVRYHPGYIVRQRLRPHHYHRGLALSEWIHHVAMSLCYDFVLDRDDCVVVSNHLCLHRRDTATVVLGSNLAVSDSRSITSWRYVAGK